MTQQEAIDELKRITEECDGDQEVAHIKADDLLCKVLTELGYPRLVEEYENICKWYA